MKGMLKLHHSPPGEPTPTAEAIPLEPEKPVEYRDHDHRYYHDIERHQQQREDALHRKGP